MERVIATLFIVGFFSALPLWGLSSQQGWVTLSGTRAGPTGPFQVQIVRRDAFSTSRETLDVTGALAEFRERTQRRTAGTVRFVLTTPQGRYEVISDVVGNTQAIASTLAPVEVWANRINRARDSGQTRFTIEIAPELTFWVMVGLVVIFALAGLVISLGGSSPSQTETQ